MHSISCLALVAGLIVLSPLAAAPAKKPTKPAPKKPAGSPAPPPAKPTVLSAQTLRATLQQQGYNLVSDGKVHRLTVKEEGYEYSLDVTTSSSGEWLVCIAHLETIPDLTEVKSAPLLALLALNDRLLGMYFSYDKSAARISLNATLPIRTLDGPTLRLIVEGVKATVREHRLAWDTSRW